MYQKRCTGKKDRETGSGIRCQRQLGGKGQIARVKGIREKRYLHPSFPNGQPPNRPLFNFSPDCSTAQPQVDKRGVVEGTEDGEEGGAGAPTGDGGAVEGGGGDGDRPVGNADAERAVHRVRQVRFPIVFLI